MCTISGISNNARILAFSVLAIILFKLDSKWVYGAPTISDSNDTTFPLELQPPLIDDGADFNGKKSSPPSSSSSSIDSYGVPVGLLKPIETPDGRKIISAQGLQFEIPNYASGITEIRKPADDLLPPFIDPIAVAADSSPSSAAAASATGTTVEVENAHLIELTTSHELQRTQEVDYVPGGASRVATASSVLPDYLLELNDPDIGGPIAYQPNNDGALKVIAWDLIPPENGEPQIITPGSNYTPTQIVAVTAANANNTKISLSTQRAVNNKTTEPQLTVEHVSEVNSRPGENTERANLNRNETKINQNYKTNFGPKAISNAGHSKSATSTTTGPFVQANTYHSTTTANNLGRTTSNAIAHNPAHTAAGPTTKTSPNRQSRRTTPAPSTTTTSTTTTADLLDPNTFYKLEAGDSYTLPPWLADFDDPDLDGAVLYDVPGDIKEYNHSISRDILPPLEPFVDIHNIQLPAPNLGAKPITEHTTRRTIASTPSTTTTKQPPTTTTNHPQKSTTATTRRPFAASTTRSHWIRANPTTRSTRGNTTTTTTITTTTTTTRKPALSAFSFSSHPSTNYHNALKPNEFSVKHSGTSTITPQNQQQQQQQQQQHQRQHPEPLHHHQTHPYHQIHQTLTTMHKPISAANKTLTVTSADDSIFTMKETPLPPSSSSSPATAEKPRNPFLPKPFQAVNPAGFTPTTTIRSTNKFPITTRTTTLPPTTTTTATTTTTTASIEDNPFDSATIPAWLSDFDYPDVGPGVPFHYDPEDPENAVFNNLLPPTNIQAETTDNIHAAESSPVSFQQSFNPSQTPVHQSNIMLTSSFKKNDNSNNDNINGNSKNSNNNVNNADNNDKTNYNENNNDNNDNHSNPNFVTLTESPIVFAPPSSITDDDDFTTNIPHHHRHHPQADYATKDTSTNFNQNFPATFDADDVRTSDGREEGEREDTAFPPLDSGANVSGGNNNNNNNSAGNIPIKTTFSKSDDGKVITNNIFLSAGSVPQTAKPFGNSGFTRTQPKDIQASSGTGASPINSNFGSFTKPPRSGASTSTAASNNGARYTGSFGGAPGVLGYGKTGYAVQPDGSIRDPDHTYRSPTDVTTPSLPKIAVAETASHPAFVGFINRASEPSASATENKYHGTFGGPPGILVPYDNTKTVKT